MVYFFCLSAVYILRGKKVFKATQGNQLPEASKSEQELNKEMYAKYETFLNENTFYRIRENQQHQDHDKDCFSISQGMNPILRRLNMEAEEWFAVQCGMFHHFEEEIEQRKLKFCVGNQKRNEQKELKTVKEFPVWRAFGRCTRSHCQVGFLANVSNDQSETYRHIFVKNTRLRLAISALNTLFWELGCNIYRFDLSTDLSKCGCEDEMVTLHSENQGDFEDCKDQCGSSLTGGLPLVSKEIPYPPLRDRVLFYCRCCSEIKAK